MSREKICWQIFFYAIYGYTTTLFLIVNLASAAPSVNVTPIKSPNAIETQIPLLPEGGEGVPVGLVINSSNLQAYKSIVVPEFIPLVRANLVEFDSVKYIKSDIPRKPIETQLSPIVLSENDIEIEAGGSLRPGVRLTEGVPFPEISKNSINERNSLDAYKMLWNIHSVAWNLNFIRSKFSVQELFEGKISQKIGASWVRVYPQRVDPENKSTQLFREKLSFVSPTSIRDYSWLSFRFSGFEEDMLWIFSPALEKIRQLTGSNRSDPLLSLNLSLDDMFGWSGKVESVQPSLQRHLIGLVPFAQLDARTLKPYKNICSFIGSENTNSGVRSLNWNFESKRFPQAFAWWPTAAVFAPRPLWRMELLPRDAFSLYGRQVIYVDSEHMLPYYKFIFNRAGALWKSVITLFQRVALSDGSKSFFVPSAMVIEDRLSKEASLIEFDQTHLCTNFPGDLALSDFDPQKMTVALQATPTPVSKK